MPPRTLQKRLEEALIRDDPGCAALADALPIEALVPLLTKYAKPVHPYGTRERVLECLEGRDEWQAVELLATFLADEASGSGAAATPDSDAHHDLRAHAAAILARKDCTRVANDIIAVLTRDLSRLMQVAPVLISLSRSGGPNWRIALEGLRTDLERLVARTDEALEQLDRATDAATQDAVDL